MQTITELIVRVADLAEAEGRLLRTRTARLALGVGIILVAVFAIAAGAGLLFLAAYIAIADRAGPAAGAAITGVLALGTGGALAWLGRRMGS